MSKRIMIRVTAAHIAEQARREQSPRDYDEARHNAAALALNEHLRALGAQAEDEERGRVDLHNSCDPDECGCLGLSRISIGDYWVLAPGVVHTQSDRFDAEPFEFALFDHWRWSRYVDDEELNHEVLRQAPAHAPSAAPAQASSAQQQDGPR